MNSDILWRYRVVIFADIGVARGQRHTLEFLLADTWCMRSSSAMRNSSKAPGGAAHSAGQRNPLRNARMVYDLAHCHYSAKVEAEVNVMPSGVDGEMTSKERILAAARRQPHDHVPVCPRLRYSISA